MRLHIPHGGPSVLLVQLEFFFPKLSQVSVPANAELRTICGSDFHVFGIVQEFGSMGLYELKHFACEVSRDDDRGFFNLIV